MRDVPSLPPVDANASVLALFDPLPALPDGRARDPYLEAGCHPEVVERVWDRLGASLPRPCAFLAEGHPVLAHPDTKVIFVFAYGTTYALWLPPSARAEATEHRALHTWGSGRTTDLGAILGDGWVWGRWDDRELDWCRGVLDADG